MAERLVAVTAVIARQMPDGPAVVVFDHPLAGVRLPAGTGERGETPEDAVLREGWEETGLPGLRIVRPLTTIVESAPGSGRGRLLAEVTLEGVRLGRGYAAVELDRDDGQILVEVEGRRGWVPAEAYTDDVVRHVVQVATEAATPDEWWVVTPDGGGLCWRCRWLPVERADEIVQGQAAWLRDAAHLFADPAPAPAPFVLPPHRWCGPDSFVQFWAYPGIGHRWVSTWIAAGVDVDDRLVRRALAVCATDTGEHVIVSGDGVHAWGFPGGGREPGEKIEETVIREVAEEACAQVTDLRLLGYHHNLRLDDAGTVCDEELQARFAARVEVRPWDPHHEISARAVLPPDQARARVAVWWHPASLTTLLTAAAGAW